MSEAKFTKGEWVADIRGGCCAVYEKSREDDTPGCHYDNERNINYSNHGASYDGHRWAMSEEHIANAHLIAMAPELYYILESILRTFGGNPVLNKKGILELLAKARGES